MGCGLGAMATWSSEACKSSSTASTCLCIIQMAILSSFSGIFARILVGSVPTVSNGMIILRGLWKVGVPDLVRYRCLIHHHDDNRRSLFRYLDVLWHL